jgi:hypothetical protein
MVGSSFLIVVGAYWDFWWHLHFGREEFWLPPHILIYSMLACLIFVTMLDLLKSRDVFGGRSLIVGGVVGFVVAGLWDDYWHRIYGPDNLDFTLVGLRTLSPPHVFAVVSGLVLGSGIMARLVAHYENRKTRYNSLLLSTYYSSGLAAVLFASIVFVPSSADTDLRLLGSVTFSFFVALFAVGTSRHLRSSLVVVQSIFLASTLQTAATHDFAYLAMFGVAGIGFVAMALADGRYTNGRRIALSGSLVSSSALAIYLALSGVSWNLFVLLQAGIAAVAGGLGALIGSRSMIPAIPLDKAAIWVTVSAYAHRLRRSVDGKSMVVRVRRLLR